MTRHVDAGVTPIQSAPVVTLQTLLATYPNTLALKQGRVHSDLVRLSFDAARLANTRFKALVRDAQFDVGELALVTYLQARVHRKPYVLLPAAVVSRSQHHTLVYPSARGPLRPSDLEHARVGVRAYTQTTGAWLRGMLQEEYGVDFRRVRWITFEDPHLVEYQDPVWVERAPAGKALLQMLLDGELDAAIFGNELPDVPLTPVIPDPQTAAARWAARHGGTPINHMVVVRESLARQRPDLVREVYRMLVESCQLSADAMPSLRFGVERNRETLALLIEFALSQRLIPRRLMVDELFDDSTRLLGAV